MKVVVPPKSVTLHWCPVCGRHDRSIPFTGASHFFAGSRCTGQPMRLTYDLSDDSSDLVMEHPGGEAA